jgi:hypothetical protein
MARCPARTAQGQDCQTASVPMPENGRCQSSIAVRTALESAHFSLFPPLFPHSFSTILNDQINHF